VVLFLIVIFKNDVLYRKCNTFCVQMFFIVLE